TWTPLAESLYQIYSYFMERDSGATPDGANSNVFRDYRFSLSGSRVSAGSSSIPADPVEYSCQKNFILIITDGEPTRDDFDNYGGTGTDWGFERFGQVIGDFNDDGETEVPGGCSECTFYLDDIAKFMQETDFREDHDGTQAIDVYTVGFTTNARANALLSKTAEVGNGLFFQSNNAEELTEAIVESVTDIIQKSQSFTAATVPASRTTDGNDIFFSSFIPSDDSSFWEGHLKNYEFTLDGRILDANGDCALDDPTGDCYFGQLLPTAPPIFDASDEIGDPDDRTLGVSLGGAVVDFDTGLSAADLGIVDDELDGPADEIALYSGVRSGSAATDLEELADEIVEYFAGCDFASSPCVPRNQLEPPLAMLGDIFHANPVVIAPPNAAINESSYIEFSEKYEERTKVIYGGSNDGFLHAFNAGSWDSVEEAFDQGDGSELFGFMPYQARLNMQYQPLDNSPRDYYFVDGSPQAADVWLYSTNSDETKEVDEWHTVMIGGMRQGGSQYYAIDITNPDSESGGPSYPEYLWEFPSEDPAHSNSAEAAYMGETWSEAIITRVRVEVSGSLGSEGEGYERWVAIFGAGFSEEGDPNDDANYSGSSVKGRAIYVVDVKTGEVLAAKRFDPSVTASGVEQEMDFAFPSAPSVFDLDRDGYADVAYIGDLGGQMWRWILTDTDPGNWELVKVLEADPFEYTVTAGGLSSFEYYYKNFFFPPTGLLRNGVLWLGVGTGERHNLKFEGVDVDGDGDADDNDGDNNRFYVFSDLYPKSSTLDSELALDESKLMDVTDADCDTPIDRGYYVVADQGEKFVTNSIVFLGTLFTGSFVPIDSTDPCIAGGEAYLWLFRFSCGAGEADESDDDRKKKLGTGLPTAPRISVGNSDEDDDDECTEMKVVVITSEGEVSSDCAGKRPNSGTYLREWRED
ncbi:MAG: hypothetical protein JRG83_09200, partial [Deltaproteobacteria bacterium]|nr:hypothetical protein [Deltaproteobacteria bacterium]